MIKSQRTKACRDNVLKDLEAACQAAKQSNGLARMDVEYVKKCDWFILTAYLGSIRLEDCIPVCMTKSNIQLHCDRLAKALCSIDQELTERL